jgi:hypothetical protein
MQIRVKEGAISVGFGWRRMCVERERERVEGKGGYESGRDG